MNRLATLFTLSLFLLLPLASSAQQAQYEFCVSSSQMESFRAVVNFKAIDLGEATARRLLYRQLQPHLQDDFQLKNFDKSCACYSSCAVLRLTPAEASKNNGEQSLLESASGNVDQLFHSAKEAWENPGGFLKTNAQRLYQWLTD